MPAYREKIYFVPKKDYYRVKIVEFPIWWDRAAFFDSYGNRQIDTGNPLYVDYGLLLTSWEAMAWDTRSREVFSRDPRSNEPTTIQAMEEFEILLKSAIWVIVESYEWESGMS